MPKKTYATRKKRRKASGPRAKSPLALASTGPQEPKGVRLVWSLIDFETCRPVVTDAGKIELGSTAHHAINVEGCLGGVFQFTDAMGIVGTLVAFPGMHPEAFVQKFDRGDADEFTYIVKDGVKEFAAVVKEEA